MLLAMLMFYLHLSPLPGVTSRPRESMDQIMFSCGTKPVYLSAYATIL